MRKNMGAVLALLALACAGSPRAVCVAKSSKACTEKAKRKQAERGVVPAPNPPAPASRVAAAAVSGNVRVPLPLEEGITRDGGGAGERVWVLLPELCETLPDGFVCVWANEQRMFLAICLWASAEQESVCMKGVARIGALLSAPRAVPGAGGTL